MIELKRALLAVPEQGPAARLLALRQKLQYAIELEHSTIPPYLYALYSIKDGTNPEISVIVRSIMMQEMLHMSLVCNVLNAIGGAPQIDKPEFIPIYPGPLPGAVENGLIVPLAPFSKQLVHEVFMVIEEPEIVPHFPVRALLLQEAPEKLTIGEFYTAIKQEIQAVSELQDIFTGAPLRQVTTGFATLQTIPVTDARSACAAIDLIIEQGEGTTISPLDPDRQLAHFYRYEEIYFGRKLIPNPDPLPDALPWAFYGHQIDFDPAGVWPVIVNPQRSTYPAGSRLRSLNDTFNATYTAMLAALHKVFNGQQDRLALAILSMQALKDQAVAMMSSELVPGLNGGPSFDYMPAADQVHLTGEIV